jgi:hypothetical protein
LAIVERIRCPACGALRPSASLGLDDDGQALDTPLHDTQVAINTIGGRGRCTWEFHRPARSVLIILRDRTAAALARINELLAEVE